MTDRLEQPFDPLDYGNIVKSVVDGLLERPLHTLGQAAAFSGAGIYAIYYAGPFPPYQRIARLVREVPIYAGKAVPPGSRKGGHELNAKRTRLLYRRLNDHVKSIAAAQNLALEDFSCRCLLVEPVWIPLAEQVLVQRFRPLWNTVIDGFGNHPPGKGRRAMRRPRWDIVHPGRGWALELTAQETVADILEDVRRHLDARPGQT